MITGKAEILIQMAIWRRRFSDCLQSLGLNMESYQKALGPGGMTSREKDALIRRVYARLVTIE